jgi:hypothetical protein
VNSENDGVVRGEEPTSTARTENERKDEEEHHGLQEVGNCSEQDAGSSNSTTSQWPSMHAHKFAGALADINSKTEKNGDATIKD